MRAPTRYLRHLSLSVLACVILSVSAATAAATVRSPCTQPGVGIVAFAGSSRAQLQNAANLAASRGLPLVIEGGKYLVDQPIILPAGLHVSSTGATLVATAPVAILEIPHDPNLAGGVHVAGITFQATVSGATGIHGELVRAHVDDCNFWTTVGYGIDGTVMDAYVERCWFGLAGPITPRFQAIHVRGGGGGNNKLHVRDCAFYSATGDSAIEVGEGCLVELGGCNIERNLTRVAVKLNGVFTADIHHCWFEHNAGESQVELLHSTSGPAVGNYVVTCHNNWWNLDGDGNLRALFTWGACHVTFTDEAGTSWSGKQIASEPGKVDLGHHWLVGLSPPDSDPSMPPPPPPPPNPPLPLPDDEAAGTLRP